MSYVEEMYRSAEADVHGLSAEVDQLKAEIRDWQAEAERLRLALVTIRNKLHAANRPRLRDGLRVECRDLADAALRESSHGR